MNLTEKKYFLLSYRRDIDGLRALAVLSVMAYHAFPRYCTGGFIGVDVFFVISGYLISSILFKNFENNNFCIRTFYARRIKRIFPALIIVLAFSLSLGWFILADPEYMLLAKHVQASAFFLANFIFSQEAGYFDINAHFKPLLHLWSLSIEEQFYLIWPLLLYVAIKRKFNLVLLMGILLILSLFISLATYNSVAVFYYPWYRFWELLSGGLLAYVAFTMKKTEYFSKQANNLFSLLGLSLILFCVFSLAQIGFVFYFQWQKFFPIPSFLLNFGNLYALLPVIGTVLIIMAGENAIVNKKILSHPLAVGLGLISYPLYLWHWSLISFAFILEGKRPNEKLLFTIIIISLFLSYLTYQFIEKPVKAYKNSKLIVLALVMFLAMIASIAHSIIALNGYHSRKVNSFDQVSPLPQFDQSFLNLRIDCAQPLFALSNAEKHFSDPLCVSNSKTPKFLMLGNSRVLSFSYSAMLFNDIDLAILTMGGNPTFLEHLDPSTDERHVRLKKINEYRDDIDALLKSYPSIEYIMLLLPTPSQHKDYVEGYVKIIHSLLSHGKKVILMLDFPLLENDPNLCVDRAINLSEKSDCRMDKNTFDDKQKEYRTFIRHIQEQFPLIPIYDPTSIFCDDAYCYGKRNHVLYYGDKTHLNLDGSKQIIQDLKIWLDIHGIK